MAFPSHSVSDLSLIPTSLFPCKSSLLHVSSFYLPTIHHSHFSTHTNASCPGSVHHPASQKPSFSKGSLWKELSPLSLSSPELYVTHTHRITKKYSSVKKTLNLKKTEKNIYFVCHHLTLVPLSLSYISIVRHTWSNPCLPDWSLLLYLLR